MRTLSRIIIAPWICLVLAVPAGCNKSIKTFSLGKDEVASKSSEPNKQPGPLHVEAEGGLSLEAQKDKQRACGELMATLDQLLRDKRLTSARRLVYRHPDLSLEILQTASGEAAKNPTVRFVAQARDQQCGGETEAHPWETLVADRLAAPDRYMAYDEARHKLFEDFKLGEGQQAAQLPLARLAASLSSPALAIDATMLSGTALEFAKRPAESVAAFRHAAELAAANDLHQAAHALLLLSDAQRHAGDFAGAIQSWQNASLLAGETLTRTIPIADPVFWERASYLRPAHVNWPDVVKSQLQVASGLNFNPNAPTASSEAEALAQSEVALFACLGRWHLARNESQTALLAFKRADASADAALQHQLRLGEAKCLSRLEQVGAATAILAGMVNQPDPSVSRPALALLGSIKLQSGQYEFGHRLLGRALEQEPTVEWPQRAEAEADLGLAYLMLGDEANGLRWLHSAQRRFAATEQQELLAKSLWNEARYFEQHGKHKAEVAGLQERLRSIESSSPVVVAGPQVPASQR